MIDYARMQDQLILHEGERLAAYLDTLDNWTIGSGYNLTARGTHDLAAICKRAFPSELSQVTVTHEESRLVLAADIVRVEAATRVHWPFYDQLDPIRQRVPLDMAFNMGFRALGFKNAIAAVERRDYSTAVKELYKSKWARQVDGTSHFGRCDRLAQMLLTGLDYTH